MIKRGNSISKGCGILEVPMKAMHVHSRSCLLDVVVVVVKRVKFTKRLELQLV